MPHNVNPRKSMTTPLPRARTLLSLGILVWLGTSAALAAQIVQSIEPDTVYFGKGGAVTATFAEKISGARFSLAPGGPHVMNSFTLPAPARDLAVTDEMVWAVAGDAGVIGIDPATLEQRAALALPGAALIRARDTQLWIADNTGLAVVDVNAPQSPRLARRIPLPAAVRALAVDDTHAYALLADHSLHVIGRADPAGAIRHKLEDCATSLAVDNGMLFLACGSEGVLILDTNGQLVGHYRTSGPAFDISVVDGTAYVALGEKGLLLLDVSDPAQPVWLGSHGRLGDARRVTAYFDRIFVTNAQGLVSAVEVDMPSMPSIFATYASHAAVAAAQPLETDAFVAVNNEIRRIDFSGEPPQYSNEGLDEGRGVNFGGQRRGFIDGDVLYVADWFSGLHLYDIRDPAKPRLLSSLHTPGSPKGVAVRAGYAYIADDDHGLQVADVRDPRAPRIIFNLPTPGLAYIPKLAGERLYLAGHRGGFQIIDIHEPAAPRLITSVDTPGMAWAVEVVNKTLFVADDAAGLLIFDISDETAPRLTGAYNPGGRAEDVLVRGGHAYLAFFDQGLHVLDVRDPSAPRLLAQIATPGNARGLDMEGDLLYLADWLAGVHVFDVTDPAQTHWLGSYDTPGAAWGMRVKNNFVHVFDWWGGLSVLDARDPRRPALAARYAAHDEVRDLAARENFLFAAQGTAGVQIFDIKNPLNPTWITGVELDGVASRTALAGPSLAVALSGGGIAFVDVNNPFEARAAARLATPGEVTILRAAGNHVFAAGPDVPLLVFDARNPHAPRELSRVPVKLRDAWLDANQTLYGLATGGDLIALDVRDPAHPVEGPRQHMEMKARFVRAAQDIAFIHDGGTLAAFAQERGALRKLGALTLPAEIRDMHVDGTMLYAATAKNGLFAIDVSDPRNMRVQIRYPLTSRITHALAQRGSLYFAGERAVTALNPLPPLAARGVETRATFDLPAKLPMGAYDLNDENGAPLRHNAVQVKMPPFSKPKFSMDDLQRALERQQQEMQP